MISEYKALRANIDHICPSCGYEDDQIRYCDECDTIVCGCCIDDHQHFLQDFEIFQ